MIEVTKLVKYYGEKKAVDSVSFRVNEGEILGFLGPNGAGKSTVMNILTGYLSATSGRVSIGGFDILEKPSDAKKCIGYLPELPPLYLDMTVSEYLDFICRLKGVDANLRRKHAANIMSMVNILSVNDRMIKNLSKGYRQRVGIAQALVGDPPIVILDEPTIGLDPRQIIEIRSLINNLRGKRTVLISTHILSEVQAMCDRVVIINHGRIVAEDTPVNLSKRLTGPYKIVVGFKSDNPDIISYLKNIAGVRHVNPIRQLDGTQYFDIVSEDQTDPRVSIFEMASLNKLPLIECRSPEMSMEDIYLKVVDSDPVKGRQTK